MKRLTFVFALVGMLANLGCSPPSEALADDRTAGKNGDVAQEDGSPKSKKVIKSDAEWKRILTPAQFYVTRMKGTERPNTGAYAHYHGKGVFRCVCCGAPLFDARTKFESGTGWPSFYAPIDPQQVATAQDFSLYEARIEVMCSTCGAHLGHVFDDGPRPTGLRYCINSVALKLEKPAPAPKAKTKAKPKTAEKATTPATEAKQDAPRE